MRTRAPNNSERLSQFVNGPSTALKELEVFKSVHIETALDDKAQETSFNVEGSDTEEFVTEELGYYSRGGSDYGIRFLGFDP